MADRADTDLAGCGGKGIRWRGQRGADGCGRRQGGCWMCRALMRTNGDEALAQVIGGGRLGSQDAQLVVGLPALQ